MSFYRYNFFLYIILNQYNIIKMQGIIDIGEIFSNEKIFRKKNINVHDPMPKLDLVSEVD
jgi:hypothetical protein